MAQVIKAEEGALSKGAQAVNSAKTGIDQQVKVVRGEIEQVRGYWSGSASASFTQLLGTWDTQVTKLNEVLVTLEAALSGTEKDQAATEDDHEVVIKNLGARMAL